MGILTIRYEDDESAIEVRRISHNNIDEHLNAFSAVLELCGFPKGIIAEALDDASEAIWKKALSKDY